MDKKVHEYKKKYPIIRPTVIKELAHGITVSNLAFQVGKEMGFSEKECHDLAIAGLLHDIGKLELAEYVYGHEDETMIVEEMKFVRLHAKLGADLLEKKGYSEKIVNMVRFHHENCDGSGYPMNPQREDIPIGSRVIRVCDVFAALTANRPYRQAFDVETAMEMMIDEAKDFDLQVFLAFMNVVHTANLDRLLNTDELEKTLAQRAAKGETPFEGSQEEHLRALEYGSDMA